MTADIKDAHLTNINNDLSKNSFSDSVKLASVTPIFKGKEKRLEMKNYKSVSIRNCFSKVDEKSLNEQLLSPANKFLSKHLSTSRKAYGASHTLISLMEICKSALDDNLFIIAVLMELSKVFDCIPRDILTVKLYAYGLSFDKITFLNSYLKERKQNAEINYACNFFLKILSGVQQGSILSPILSNIFLNDLFLCLTKSELSNFADDNTLEIQTR